MSFTRILRDFADWCSLPGLIQLINALNAYIRVTWIVIWSGLWCLFIYELYLIAQNFLQYPAAVNFSFGYKSRAFPLVTICNQNSLRYTKIKNNATYANVMVVQGAYSLLVKAHYGNIVNDSLGVNDIPGTPDKVTYLQSALVLAINQLTEDQIAYASYKFGDFIVAWYYNGYIVPADYFTEFFDPTYGLCYQFNANTTANLTLLGSDRSGRKTGLRATVLAHQYKADGTREYLPTTNEAGLRIGINYQDESPCMENYGINVGMGSEASLAIRVTEINRLKAPYGDCSDESSLNYYGNFNYTLIYCFRSCVQQIYIAGCGCASPLYPKPDDVSYCTMHDLNCLWMQKQGQNNGSEFSVSADCGCKPSCADTSFDITGSSARFPAGNYLPLVDGDPRYSCTLNSTLGSYFPNLTQCYNWFLHNAAVINVYYEDLSYMLQREDESYTISSASNDLGGQAGVCVGISLINVVEMLVLCIVVTVYLLKGRKDSDMQVTDKLRETDRRYNCIREIKEELDTQELMDEEIQVRHRALKLRQEKIRQDRLLLGHKLNEMAVTKKNAN